MSPRPRRALETARINLGLHQDPGADQRARRCFIDDGRRSGDGGADRRTDTINASSIRSMSNVTQSSTNLLKFRSGARAGPAEDLSGPMSGQAHARRRLDLQSERQASSSPRLPSTETCRHLHPARRIPQSRQAAAARHVCSRHLQEGVAENSLPGAAARCRPQHQGRATAKFVTPMARSRSACSTFRAASATAGWSIAALPMATRDRRGRAARARWPGCHGHEVTINDATGEMQAAPGGRRGRALRARNGQRPQEN
jgi:hypothetical protein